MQAYSVRVIFKWSRCGDQRLAYLYEERITLWRAESIDEAIELGEQEAAHYARDGREALDLIQANALAGDMGGCEQGFETFSLLRESDLEPADYLDHFFDTGFERQSKSAVEQ